MKNISVFIIVTLLFFSCKKEEETDPLPTISNIPSIVSVSNKTAINQFEDLIFTIHYTDGNGDLGEVDPDKYSVFITDNRDVNIIHKFHVQPLAPMDKTLTIEGNLLVNLKSVILLDQNNTSETVKFHINLIDRAGNTSNSFTTSAIIITK